MHEIGLTLGIEKLFLGIYRRTVVIFYFYLLKYGCILFRLDLHYYFPFAYSLDSRGRVHIIFASEGEYVYICIL